MKEILTKLDEVIASSPDDFLHTSSGEYLGFMYPLEGNGESKVYDLWHEAPAEEWAEAAVYNSFADLLNDYIDNKGRIETM